MKMTRAVTLYLLFVTKLLLLNIFAAFSLFSLSLSFSSIYMRCLPTHHKNTRRCVLRVRDRENESESETRSGDLEPAESLRRASKRERDQFESLYTTNPSTTRH